MRWQSITGLVLVLCLVSFQVGSTPGQGGSESSHQQRNFLKAEVGLARRALRDARQLASRLRTASQSANMQVVSARQRVTSALRLAKDATAAALRSERKWLKATAKIKQLQERVYRAHLYLERCDEKVRKMELQTQSLARRSNPTLRDLKRAASQLSYQSTQSLMELRRMKLAIKQLVALTKNVQGSARQAQALNHKARLATIAGHKAQDNWWQKRLRAATLSSRVALAVQQVKSEQLRLQATQQRLQRLHP